MHHIFVFGTLKEGFPNFKTNHGQRVPGEFVTRDPYALYLVGDRHSPWLVADTDKGCYVGGQVFEVDDAGLAEMDRLERIDQADGYRRVQLTVVNRMTDAELRVFAYLKPEAQMQGADIRIGPIEEYTQEHAGLYRRRSE